MREVVFEQSNDQTLLVVVNPHLQVVAHSAGLHFLWCFAGEGVHHFQRLAVGIGEGIDRLLQQRVRLPSSGAGSLELLSGAVELDDVLAQVGCICVRGCHDDFSFQGICLEKFLTIHQWMIMLTS